MKIPTVQKTAKLFRCSSKLLLMTKNIESQDLHFVDTVKRYAQL